MNRLRRWWYEVSGAARTEKRKRILEQAPEFIKSEFDRLLSEAIERDDDILKDWLGPEHSEEDRVKALILWGYATGVEASTKLEENLSKWVREKYNEPYQG